MLARSHIKSMPPLHNSAWIYEPPLSFLKQNITDPIRISLSKIRQFWNFVNAIAFSCSTSTTPNKQRLYEDLEICKERSWIAHTLAYGIGCSTCSFLFCRTKNPIKVNQDAGKFKKTMIRKRQEIRWKKRGKVSQGFTWFSPFRFSFSFCLLSLLNCFFVALLCPPPLPAI